MLERTATAKKRNNNNTILNFYLGNFKNIMRRLSTAIIPTSITISALECFLAGSVFFIRALPGKAFI